MAFNTKAPISKRLFIGLLSHITLILYALPITGKKQKMLNTWIFDDYIQTSLVKIFQYLTLSRYNKKEIVGSIYQRSTEILMKSDKLSNLHMFTQKITFMCHWKDLFGNDVKKRTRVEIEVCRIACLKAVQDKTITIDTLSSDKIRRIN